MTWGVLLGLALLGIVLWRFSDWSSATPSPPPPTSGDPLEQLVQLAGTDPERAFRDIDVAWEADRPDVVEKVARAVVKRRPSHVDAADQLLRALFDQGKIAKVEKLLARASRSEPIYQLYRVELLLEQGDTAEAGRIVSEVCTRADSQLRSGLFDGTHPYWADVFQRANRLRESMLVAVEGRGAALRHAAAAGQLAPRSGVNHKLVGLSAMAESPRLASQLELQPVSSADTPLRRAEAALRDLDPGRAEKLFRAMVDADPCNWPAQLGLGAALTARDSRSVSAVRRLPNPEIDPVWEQVFPDWPVLELDERKVVAASARPLAAALPGLVAGGVVIRILPIDVRPTDLPAFHHHEHTRTDDGRALAGIGGMASSQGLAISRVEDLLNIGEDRTFAHELAHLAFWALPAATQERFVALFEAASQVEWAWTEYQRKNVDEFFAVSYETWLARKWGVDADGPDGSGWWAEVDGFFAGM